MTKKQILDEMKTLLNSDDTEFAHIQADSLLIELIRSLSSDCEDVIEAYENVEKWFA